MFKYKIGYSTYEESHYIELEHEQKFTHDELTKIIAEAAVAVVKTMVNDKDYVHSFQDVFSRCYMDNKKADIEGYLIKEKGFKLIEYAENWYTFGWASIFHKEDWKDNRDDDLNKITDAVNAAGFTKDNDSFDML